MLAVILAALLSADPAAVAVSKTPTIEMIIDDGVVVMKRDQLYPSLQLCLDDTQQLFIENAHQIKLALRHEAPLPKPFSVKCQSLQINKSEKPNAR